MTHEPAKRDSRNGSFFWTVFCALLALGLVYSFSLQRDSEPPTSEGFPLPSLQVEGWTNVASPSDAPLREALLGQHVVIDAWATWCPPCRRAMPDLARIHDRWAGRGVAFLGITSEGSTSLASIDEFTQSVPGFVWPVAYGGNLVLEQLGVTQLPTLILFDPQGRSVWRGHSTHKLEAQLAARL